MSRLRPSGARRERWAEWHDHCRTAVRVRAQVSPGFLRDVVAWGKCEGCGRVLPIDWAHLYGRGNLLAEPWCSLPELTAALCRRCHESIDEAVDLSLRLRLRWEAIRRLARRFPQVQLVSESWPKPFDAQGAVDCARACERRLHETVDAVEFVAIALLRTPRG